MTAIEENAVEKLRTIHRMLTVDRQKTMASFVLGPALVLHDILAVIEGLSLPCDMPSRLIAISRQKVEAEIKAGTILVPECLRPVSNEEFANLPPLTEERLLELLRQGAKEIESIRRRL